MKNNPTPLFDYQGELPECPTWDADTQSLFWTDILKKQIHRYQPQTGEQTVFHFEEEVGCFALRERGGFIVAMRSGIWLADQIGALTQKVCDNPNNPQLARFNDGGTDWLGRFYAGTYWGPRDYNGALLCRVDAALKTTVVQCDILGANGLAFSADKKWMYTSDTPNHVIYRTPLDADGNPGQRQVWETFPRGNGRPDGAAMDTEGCYWSALFDGWRIARFSPQGEIIEEYALPVRCPTMVCFGGDDLKTLFITTTRENMTAEEIIERPLSGAIFTLQVAVAGVAKAKFKES
ncbi:MULTISPECIES: SMP-30/gluconolactonase/LRE family protein [Edwardsiella]|uniref:SMP-30/Gluconolaconase/LRE protein n=2 Tax=Edwardsiella anguillarum TaxID=1821960 RepID=A0A076LIZ5_9GAMM|nr:MULTISPECIES: SMP-30/gluconolactonase/LRE family protein [Edwardsiella]AKM46157.1 gluconolactonase [Edwardsiella sp. EA181011]GAJ67180.1 SMP-30/gluconolaconase/LRE protein [Edwardsiella piscicida]AIJ08510.1 SMP-30/Gluconolaconase/LRE protein [Edwardsiella anguillarum ET080813]AKR76574.1 SMP-30/gluconolactonase/LRE family protein [Edwardsiella sp. LADL05-105]KAB0593033.1 SMP-30/gluconolactonase/LRE family protein [Edwardsiella anguillarum]